MMGTPRTGDKSVIQNKKLFKFYTDGFISTSSNSEQKEQTNKEKYVFYCNDPCISNSHQSWKNTKKHNKSMHTR